jgi:Cys-tRNA(Pro)/Cys-tRNA(Cys) deacylase
VLTVTNSRTPATALLSARRVPYTSHGYAVAADTPAYGEAVAAALGVEPARVFKTLVATVDGALTVGVVPVARTLDLKALAGSVGGKRGAMAEPAAAQRATGYVTGGISPLGQRTRLPVVIDDSALGWDTVYVSGGRRGLQLELAPADLVRLSGATVAAIAR